MFVPQSASIGFGTVATVGSVVLSAPALATFTGTLSLAPSQAPDETYLPLTVRCDLILTSGADVFDLTFAQAGTLKSAPTLVPISLTSYTGQPGTLSVECQIATANNGSHFIVPGGGRISWITGS